MVPKLCCTLEKLEDLLKKKCCFLASTPRLFFWLLWGVAWALGFLKAAQLILMCSKAGSHWVSKYGLSLLVRLHVRGCALLVRLCQLSKFCGIRHLPPSHQPVISRYPLQHELFFLKHSLDMFHTLLNYAAGSKRTLLCDSFVKLILDTGFI